MARPDFLRSVTVFFAGVLLAACVAGPASAQQLAKRLILKDGSYQLATQWEVKGDRLRYYSAERSEWEEVPNSMVDWDATEKYAKEREAGAPPPEAIALDKEIAAENATDEAKSPHVAPGLRLPEDSDVVLLDSYQGQPELLDLQQSSGELNRNTKGNILRGAINPIASAKQTIELPGSHAKIQAHAALPSVYVNVVQQDQGGEAAAVKDKQPQLPWDRFKIVQAQSKQGNRIVGALKVAVYGKVSQEQKLVPTTAEQLTGGWVKVTPKEPLAPGEYALVEMLGKDGMNLYVWDFGVNPSAPANTMALKPDASVTNPAPEKPIELEKRP
jgi:hypothetical protein